MKRMKKLISLALASFLIFGVVFGTDSKAYAAEKTIPANGYDVTLMAVGDNLMHMGIVATGKQSDGSYNFDFLFDGIKPYLDKCDIKIINQETPLAGNSRGFSGYPKFNSPTEVGDSIARCGFNVVLQASNHSNDQGIDGLLSIYDFWTTKHPEVLLTGIHGEDMKDDIPIIEVQGIKVAVLNYTYSANAESFAKSLDGHLNLLCELKPNSRTIDFTKLNPKVIEDITKAKTMADVVVVCPHWGNEYQLEPSAYQKNFAMQMTEAGADVIIGAHPHVVQPIEYITASNGNVALCYYSLGNYVSTQKGVNSMFELMAYVTFHVSPQKEVTLVPGRTGALPLVCHYRSGPVRMEGVIALDDYTEEKASKHGIINYGGVKFHKSDMDKLSDKLVGDFRLTKDDIFG